MGVKFMLTSSSRKKNVNSFFILITHCTDNILNILVEIKYIANNHRFKIHLWLVSHFCWSVLFHTL